MDLVHVLDVENCSGCGKDHKLTVIPCNVTNVDGILYYSQGICPKSQKIVYSTYEFNAPLLDTEKRV